MRYFFWMLMVVSILQACNKDEEFTIDEERLEGFWLLTDITGGFSGSGYEASFDHLQMNGGLGYSLMIQDAVIQEGSYQLSTEDDQHVIQFIPDVMDTIGFDDYKKRVLYNDSGDVLTLSDPCCDLFNYTFTKEE